MTNPEASLPQREELAFAVQMNEVCTINYDPSVSRQAVGYSALYGCIAVAALFRGAGSYDASAILSHFPPSGNLNKSAANIAQAVSSQLAQGRKPEHVVIMAPGEWTKNETTGYWNETPYATVEPDIEGYKQVLGMADVTNMKVSAYIPDELALQGLSPDPYTGTILAEFYESSEGMPKLRVIVEGEAVPMTAK